MTKGDSWFRNAAPRSASCHISKFNLRYYRHVSSHADARFSATTLSSSVNNMLSKAPSCRLLVLPLTFRNAKHGVQLPPRIFNVKPPAACGLPSKQERSQAGNCNDLLGGPRVQSKDMGNTLF